MFHYSVSGDNKSQVKSRLPGRGFSVRDIVVLSRSCKESISWRTSNWQPAWDFRLEKVIVRYVESMLSSLYSLCLTLSDWGDGLMFSKNNYKKTKRTLVKKVGTHDRSGVMWRTSIVTVKEKQTGKTDIAHLSQTDETAQWWQAVGSSSDMLSQCTVWQREFNFLSATCMSTITEGFHKGNRPMEK